MPNSAPSNQPASLPIVNNTIAHLVKQDEYNQSAMKLIQIVAYSKDNKLPSSLEDKFKNHIKAQNNQILQHHEAQEDSILNKTIESITKKAEVYNNFLELETSKNLLEIKLATLLNRDVYHLNIKDTLSHLYQELKEFDFSKLQLQQIANQADFESLLDLTEPNDISSLRNLSLENISKEKLNLIKNKKKLNNQEILTELFLSQKDNALEIIGESFQEEALDLLTKKLEFDTTRPANQITAHDSILTLVKKIWNGTVVNTARIMKLGN